MEIQPEQQGDLSLAQGVLDNTELGIVQVYRDLKSHGYGRMEVVVVHHKLDRVTPSPTYKEGDLTDYLDKSRITD